MQGLRLELCQQAGKSFLHEKLNKFDSLGTMKAFTLFHKVHNEMLDKHGDGT